MHKYSEEENQFIIDNVEGIALKELTRRFNKKFNLNVTEKAIANRKNKLGLKSGIVGGQFQKGQVSWNKGKKWDDYMSKESQKNQKKTQFKKGNVPANHRPIWSERINKDGYVKIKIEEPNKWEYKNRYIYEQIHGKIPKGHKVIFADGNNRNFDLDNLVLVSKSELLIINRNGLYTKNKELTKSGCLVAKVIDKTRKINKEKICKNIGQ